jgi:hypothetical protein
MLMSYNATRTLFYFSYDDKMLVKAEPQLDDPAAALFQPIGDAADNALEQAGIGHFTVSFYSVTGTNCL